MAPIHRGPMGPKKRKGSQQSKKKAYAKIIEET